MNWINVNEQKPEPNALVLCWVANKYFMCGRWYTEIPKGAWMLDDGEVEGDVTHWMPLPDAPMANAAVREPEDSAKK
jgi:hypothetical protein